MSVFLERVKQNLIITHNEDDALIEEQIAAAIRYAEEYQHVEPGFYESHPMPETTQQGVILLASFFYESRDGATGGFFANMVSAPEQTWKTVNRLLLLNREWSV